MGQRNNAINGNNNEDVAGHGASQSSDVARTEPTENGRECSNGDRNEGTGRASENQREEEPSERCVSDRVNSRSARREDSTEEEHGQMEVAETSNMEGVNGNCGESDSPVSTQSDLQARHVNNNDLEDETDAEGCGLARNVPGVSSEDVFSSASGDGRPTGAASVYVYEDTAGNESRNDGSNENTERSALIRPCNQRPVVSPSPRKATASAMWT